MNLNWKLSCKSIFLVIVVSICMNTSGLFLETAYSDTLEKSDDSEISLEIGERPTLIVGDDINYPPYSFIDDNGKPAGFSIELIKKVANTMGYDVEYRLGGWNGVRTQLENDEIDLISGMFYSKQREDLYEFTTKHSVTTGGVFSKKEHKITDVTDLIGKTVVVQKSDIVHEYLLNKDMDITFIEVETVSEAINLVANDTYDYAALLKPTTHFIMGKEKIKGVDCSDINLGLNDFCIAVNEGNEELAYMLNGGLQLLKSTGEYQVIYDKWLGVYEEKTILEIINEYAGILLMILLVMVLMALWLAMLKRVVYLKTKELLDSNQKLIASEEELTATNEELEASFEELMAIEEELRSHYERLLESETNLIQSEERSKAIVNAIPDLLFIMDEKGEITKCKASDLDELTMPEEQFIGKTLKDIMPAAIAEEGYGKITEALVENKVQSFKYELEIRDRVKHFEMRISKSQENEVVGITRDITEEREYQQKFEYLSYRDQLTGLYNRRFFEEELARLDDGTNLPFSIVMADVNGLKLINDSFGHDMGDKLLIKVADVLNKACSLDNIISRTGGDEFVILLPGVDDGGAEKLIKRIREACVNEKVVSMDLSISFGWATKLSPEESIHEILNIAEDNMYKRKLFEGPSMRGKTIGAIVNTLHEKNVREEEHSKRVSEYSHRLAKILEFSERDTNEIKNAALLHDIGKVAINEFLLNKPGKLSLDEMKELKRHPEIGYRILSSVNDMAEMSEIVLHHHERWDGLGYPKGLKGKEIPLQARIIAIADSFDAMVSERSYKKPMSLENAIKEIEISSGTQFDPELSKIFIDEILYPLLTDEDEMETDIFIG